MLEISCTTPSRPERRLRISPVIRKEGAALRSADFKSPSFFRGLKCMQFEPPQPPGNSPEMLFTRFWMQALRTW